MKSFLISIAMLSLVTALSYGNSAQQPNARNAKIEQELKNLVRQWDEADERGDAATLERLLADEFAFVGGQTKAQYLEELRKRPSSFKITSAVSADLQVHLYGETAVLTGVDTITGENNHKPYVNKWLYLDVWVKLNGRWQCVKTLATLVK